MQRKKKSPCAQSQEISQAFAQTTNRRTVELSEEQKRHPLVCERYFYTLPMGFWKVLLTKIGENRFDPETLMIDLKLARICDSIGTCVGFRNGLPLTDSLLRPINQLSDPNPITAEYFRSLGWTIEQIRHFCRKADRRVEMLSEARRGYLGWLFTNHHFLEEFEALKGDCPEITGARKSVPLAFAQSIGETFVPRQLRPMKTSDPAMGALQQFYERWRLQSITGPRTIQPIGIQFPVMLPGMSSAQSQSSGALLYVPDIAPLPDRDELRLMLENSIRESGDSPVHLAEWITLVRAKTMGKRSIQKYARWYRIQHVLRVLYSRHANSLHRCNRKIEEVLIEGLSIKSDTIHRDMIDLRRRLTADWFNK